MKNILIAFIAILSISLSVKATEDEAEVSGAPLRYQSFFGWIWGGTHGGPYSGSYSKTKCKLDSSASWKLCKDINAEDIKMNMDLDAIKENAKVNALSACYEQGYSKCTVIDALSSMTLREKYRLYPDTNVINTAYRSGYITTVLTKAE